MELLWQEIEATAKHHDIEIMPSTTRPRQHRRTPASLGNYLLTADSIGVEEMSQSSSEGYKISVHFPTIDVIIAEINKRFSDDNLLLMKGIDALCPNSSSFLSIAKMEPFLQQYSKCLPQLDNLKNEVILLKNYLTRNPIPEETRGSSGLHALSDCIQPMKAAFPILNECFHIALTLGTSTATVECSFSSLHRVKTYLRSTMTQQKLNSLALIYIERDLSSRLWESLVLQFSQTHKNCPTLVENSLSNLYYYDIIVNQVIPIINSQDSL